MGRMGAFEAMGAGQEMRMRPAPPKKELDELHLKEGEEGGHTVTHTYTDYMHKPKEHVFGSDQGRELVEHLIKHANIKGVKLADGDGGGDGDE